MAVNDRAEPLDTRCTGAGASNPRSRGPLNNTHEEARDMAVTSAQTRQVSDSLARLLTLLPRQGLPETLDSVSPLRNGCTPWSKHRFAGKLGEARGKKRFFRHE
jgi:hypothetical protein